MKLKLSALLLALLPTISSAQIPPPVTVEAVSGSWAIGYVFMMAGDEPADPGTTCISCMQSNPWEWTLIQRDACDGSDVVGFAYALACAEQPISGATYWRVTGHPSANCWTLEYCYP